MALSEDGNIYTWGYGGKKGYFNWMYSQEVGALGLGSLDPHFTPKLVKFFPENDLKVTQIAAGNYHCVALASDGNLYTWGRGLYGVLGNGSNLQSLVPERIEEFVYYKEDDP